MPRRANALTARRVQTAPVGRHYDGDGLILLVREPDRAWWLLRYTLHGKTREIGLGRARGPNSVSLAGVRVAALKLRVQLAEGTDPLAQRDLAKSKARAEAVVAAITFAKAADIYFGAHAAGWGSAKHVQQWNNTIATYALPVIGTIPVADVSTAEVLAILQPLWVAKTATASRLRGRLESVLDFAKARGWRSAPNAAQWKGHLSSLLPKPGKVAKVEHHAALDWREIATFMTKLAGQSSAAALALQFAVLTAGRSGEVRGATWSEIDLDAAVWTIPAVRMKAAKEHKVPLSSAAIDVLTTVAALRTDPAPAALVFPGQRPGRPLDDRGLTAALRATGHEGSVHGMRSSFRDWAAEATATPNHVVEQALAHRIGSAVEAAYRRGDLFEKRTVLMAEWAAFCSRPAAQVVPLRAEVSRNAVL